MRTLGVLFLLRYEDQGIVFQFAVFGHGSPANPFVDAR